MSSASRESVLVLEECIELQKRKSQDYQNPNSNIVQAMHYRRGVSTIHDMISQKLLRAQSLLEAYENGEGNDPNFESLEDTYKDLINYASFAVSYIRGKMEGQDPQRDMLNRRNALREYVSQKRAESATQYIRKPPGGGTGTGVEITKEEFEKLREEGHATPTEEIEDDGFITVHPVLLGADLQPDTPVAKIPLKEDSDGDTPDSRIKGAYLKRVLPRGKVTLPPGESLCTDNVAITYDREMKGKRNNTFDKNERNYDELMKNKSEK